MLTLTYSLRLQTAEELHSVELLKAHLNCGVSWRANIADVTARTVRTVASNTTLRQQTLV